MWGKPVQLNILIVECHPALRQARAAIFQTRGYTVTCCAERHSAVRACGATAFDVAVVGPSVPIDDARQLEWNLRTINPEIKVLSVGEWDNLGLDEIHKPEFLLELIDGLIPAAVTEISRRRSAPRASS